MFFFMKEDVYTGYSMEELSTVRTILKKEGIKYTYKVIDSSEQWLGTGTSRGNFGSSNMNKSYDKQYIVSVRRKDVKYAQYLVHQVLHS